jgi:hypothetical protein
VLAGYFASAAPALMGRRTNSPPQLGQAPSSTLSAQPAQNVHSKLQIRALVLSAGKSQSQTPQLGLSCSITRPL